MPARVEVRQAGENDPANGSHHAKPQHFRQPPDGRDAPVKQKHGKEADQYRNRRSRHDDPAHLQRSAHGKMQRRVMCAYTTSSSGQ